jgi:hypothetical protein
VAALAQNLGWSPIGAGKVVWFEIGAGGRLGP